MSFTPVLAPLPRGILATCTARTDASAAEVVEAYAKAYADEPFVHLLPEGTWPTTAATLGANTVHLQVTVDPDARRAGRRRCDRQPHQGHRRRRRAMHEPGPGTAGDHRPAADGGGSVTVTTPRGFRAAGVAAGLKSTGALDLALVVNDGPAHAAAGVFTRNKVKAAPVLWSQQVLTTGRLRAVVLNSGGANACTGPEGFQTAHATAEKAAEALGCAPLEVAVCSTGLIGKQLPREAVLGRGRGRRGGARRRRGVGAGRRRPRS